MMSEPHQRIRSGKLRKSSRRVSDSAEYRKVLEKRTVYTGIENATELVPKDVEEEYATYLQTPTDLCNSQIKILEQVALGYGITDTNAIDPCLRRTWNIGTWHIGSKASISINLRQPNIANYWVNIRKVDIATVESIARIYTSTNLARSTCSVVGSGTDSQVKGRWTPNVVDTLLERRLITEDDVEIIGLNICQSTLFCWMILSTGSRYLCLLTKESVDILVRYLPDWCVDITETSSGGSVALKLRNPPIVNDASHLSVSDSGGLQYQGRSENIRKLAEALSMSIHSTVSSVHFRLFLDSFEYKQVK